MHTIIHGNRDEAVDAIAGALDKYAAEHPEARTEVFRLDWTTVWIRVVDPDLAAVDDFGRVSFVWKYIRELPDPIPGHIGRTVPVLPEQVDTHVTSMLFDDALAGRYDLAAA